MASINSYGGMEHRGDGGRWTQPAPKPGSGVGGRPLSQLGGVTLSSYKGGEGVNVDRPADDNSDSSDRGENGFTSGAASQQRSTAWGTKDKAQQQQQQLLQTTSTSIKGAAKAVAAKGKQRKLREKRRGTGVVHLPVGDQSTGDSLDDDDDADDGSTKYNTSSNEGSGGLPLQTPTAASQARATDMTMPVAASAFVAEQSSKFGPRASASSGYTRSWQPEPAAGAAEASGAWGAGSTRLHSESPGREESPTAPALRSCLKGAGGASAKDAPARRPVTSLVNQFELTRPQTFSNGGGGGGGSSNSSSSSAAPIPSSTAFGPARGSREDGAQACTSQLRGQKEEDVGRGGSASYPASAQSAVSRYPGDGAAYASSSSWSGPNLPPQGSAGLTARAAVSSGTVLPTPQPARAPVLPPWKQPMQPDVHPATAGSGGNGGSAMFNNTATTVSQHMSAPAVSFGRASLSSIDDGSLSGTVAPPSRQTNEPGKRTEAIGGGPGSAAVDDLQRKIADLQKTIEKLQATNSQYHKVLTEREREVEKLERDLQAKNAHIAVLEHDLEELDHDNISLAEENDALRNAVATLSKQ